MFTSKDGFQERMPKFYYPLNFLLKYYLIQKLLTKRMSKEKKCIAKLRLEN